MYRYRTGVCPAIMANDGFRLYIHKLIIRLQADYLSAYKWVVGVCPYAAFYRNTASFCFFSKKRKNQRLKSRRIEHRLLYLLQFLTMEMLLKRKAQTPLFLDMKPNFLLSPLNAGIFQR